MRSYSGLASCAAARWVYSPVKPEGSESWRNIEDVSTSTEARGYTFRFKSKMKRFRPLADTKLNIKNSQRTCPTLQITKKIPLRSLVMRAVASWIREG